MELRIRDTGQVITDSEFRSLHPNTGFPQVLTADLLNSFGVDAVLEGPQAQPTRYQIAFRDGVTQDEQGRWFTKYSVSDMDADAIAALDAQQAVSQRAERTRLIAESDWTQLPDSPVDKQAWSVYRQALRDLPSQAGFPWDINWPQQPE